MPSYHDLFITTAKIPRTALFNLPFRVEVICSRASGWTVWAKGEERAGLKEELLGGEYGYDDETGEGWLILDVAGHEICNSMPLNAVPVHGDNAVFAEMDRDVRQDQAVAWAKRAFGLEVMDHPAERGARVQEEANELGQAMGVPRETAHKIVEYVYDRPAGDAKQELGGVGLCLLIAAESIEECADAAERQELNRVLGKPPEHFKARHDAKAAHGITPGLSKDRP
jgi:hypothetical protein